MIRLRGVDGKVIEVPVQIAAIELCSTDGLVAQVIVESGPRIMRYTTKDKELIGYCKAIGVEPAKEIHIVSERE